MRCVGKSESCGDVVMHLSQMLHYLVGLFHLEENENVEINMLYSCAASNLMECCFISRTLQLGDEIVKLFNGHFSKSQKRKL